jgi:hypothetical protein
MSPKAAPPAAPRSRPLAAHVRQALAAAAQARLEPGSSRPAPHVAAMVASLQRPPGQRQPIPPPHAAPRSAVQRQASVARPLAPHVQSAIVACRPGPPARGPAAPAVVQRMEEYSGWEDLKEDPLFHPPSPGASPVREDQKEILDKLRDEMVKQSQEKKRRRIDQEKKVSPTNVEKKIKKQKVERPQPKETVKGNAGEHAAERYYKLKGIPCLDANRLIQKNIAGIDHIINHGDFCFSQSKVHIRGKSKESVEALALEYQKNIDHRFDMALLFLQKVIKGKKIKRLADANKQIGDNKILAAIVEEIQKSDYDTVEDMDTGMKAVKWAGEAILFPVPKDIYAKLSEKHRDYAFALDEEEDWFFSTLRKSFYVESKTKLSGEQREQKEDPSFEVEEEEES